MIKKIFMSIEMIYEHLLKSLAFELSKGNPPLTRGLLLPGTHLSNLG